MFKVKPLKEILAMTSQAVDEALAPIRARQIKAKAETSLAQMDERLVTLERRIHEMCAEKDINFESVMDKMDDYELTQRRQQQLRSILASLFPEDKP